MDDMYSGFDKLILCGYSYKKSLEIKKKIDSIVNPQ